MKRTTPIFFIPVLWCFLAAVLMGQSLEELASQQRTQKAPQVQPVKAYTNGDLTLTSFRRTEASASAVDPEAAAQAVAPATIARMAPAAPSVPGMDEDPAGELNVNYQSFYNRINNTSTANQSGLSMSFLRFFPKHGLLSLRFEPMANLGSFNTGENYAQWKGLPWKGRHWDFSLGDFRSSTALVTSPLSNVNQPEFFLRGAAVTARAGSWRYSLFAGSETLSQGQRVPFRTAVPQKALGAEVSGRPFSWLQTGFRYLHLTSQAKQVEEKTSFFPVNRQILRSDSLTAQTNVKLAKGLEWYTETGWNNATSLHESDRLPVSFSVATGPSWRTTRSVIQANFVRQGTGYLPAVGYFLGDRRGPNANGSLHLGIFDFSGSWGQTSNNLEHNPAATGYFSRQSSGSLSVRLPFRFGLSGSISTIALEIRAPGQSLQPSDNRQINVSLNRIVFGHNLRAGFQQLDIQQPGSKDQLRFLDLEDTFRLKQFTLGGAVRLQHSVGGQRKDSLFFRGNVQVQFLNVSLYAYLEQGKDLANTTLFATSAISTSVMGLSWQAPRKLSVQLEAFRNNTNTNLNPASIFVQASQGIPVDTTLSRFNNWSVYLRVTRHFNWGDRLDFDPSGSLRRQAPITGKIAGYVRMRTEAGNPGAPNVTVRLESGKQATTDENGYFSIPEVPEGTQPVTIDTDTLPSEYGMAGTDRVAVLVRPDQIARVELEVIPFQSITGVILDAAGTPAPEGVVVELEPAKKFTTTDKQGRFGFYDLPEGNYAVILQADSLPEFAQPTSPTSVPVALRHGSSSGLAIQFQYRIVPPPPKPLRNVLQGQNKLINYEPK